MSWCVDGPRISIVPFSEQHLTLRYVSWLNDPIVTRYSELRHRTHSIESCRMYWEESRRRGHFFGAVIEKTSQVHIANISAYRDLNNSVIDLAILLGERKFWGKGYGRETWIAMMNFIICKGVARKVTGGTMSTNTAMLRIFQEAGMHEDGRRLRQFVFEGQEIDALYFARFANTGVARLNHPHNISL